MAFVFANNVQTTLAAPIASTDTVIALSSSANFPTIPAGDKWVLTLNDAATGLIYEVVYATSTSGANVTVERGQEGTTARAWAALDYIYAANTAGIMSSLVQGGAGNLVQLSPASAQTGYIDITGAVTAGGQGSFAGVSVGGALSGATSGSFSADVTALDLITSRAYSNLPLSGLPLRFQGFGGVVGVGPSSGLSVRSIPAAALAIGVAGSANFVAFDNDGNVGVSNDILCASLGADSVFATLIEQNTVQVLDTLTSPDNSITIVKSGNSATLEVAGSSNVPIGGSIVLAGTASTASQNVPSYGSWLSRVIVNFTQSSNSNAEFTISLTAGSVSNTINGGDGFTTFNSTAYGLAMWTASVTVPSQTLSWSFSCSQSLDHLGWTIELIRTA